jgi:hypothetical protein
MSSCQGCGVHTFSRGRVGMSRIPRRPPALGGDLAERSDNEQRSRRSRDRKACDQNHFIESSNWPYKLVGGQTFPRGSDVTGVAFNERRSCVSKGDIGRHYGPKRKRSVPGNSHHSPYGRICHAGGTRGRDNDHEQQAGERHQRSPKSRSECAGSRRTKTNPTDPNPSRKSTKDQTDHRDRSHTPDQARRQQ